MRVLHVTDTHLGADRPVRGGPRGWSRADDHLAALQSALAHGEQAGARVVVHSGDVFDRSRPPRRAVVAAADLLCAAARWATVIVVPGNHDRRGLSRWLPHARLRVHDAPARVTVGGVTFALVPFQPTAERFAEAARTVGAHADVLVAHQAFHGARVPGLVFRVGAQRDTIGAEHLPPGVASVWCGHLHPRQVVRVGGAEVVHPGATERTSWSERDQAKGWVLWDLSGTPRPTFVDGPARPMIEVDGPEDLVRVLPGSLVRAAGVRDEEVLARGGRLVGPPDRSTTGPSRPRPAAPPDDGLDRRGHGHDGGEGPGDLFAAPSGQGRRRLDAGEQPADPRQHREVALAEAAAVRPGQRAGADRQRNREQPTAQPFLPGLGLSPPAAGRPKVD